MFSSPVTINNKYHALFFQRVNQIQDVPSLSKHGWVRPPAQGWQLWQQVWLQEPAAGQDWLSDGQNWLSTGQDWLSDGQD